MEMRTKLKTIEYGNKMKGYEIKQNKININISKPS